ncbi:hypothetical protein FRAHR75_150101 [Frankia sp. Hr75.2]|nr:hypothetical protein FRAHR75_150101 [Frankia sp. Hr75.2]SQD96637.1 hypothetical protein FMEAI12_3670034 [Parafrankia sp. Ea1.12]
MDTMDRSPPAYRSRTGGVDALEAEVAITRQTGQRAFSRIGRTYGCTVTGAGGRRGAAGGGR